MRLFAYFRDTWTGRIAVGLLASNLVSIGLPGVAYALTSGPSQPEFSSFEPVGASDMVNKFTGDFSYSIPVLEIPGPDGSSYPLSLSYHSGINPEEEASWVGYGWTLNPGAINRTARGFPDDFAGSEVQYWHKTPKNWTVTAGHGAGFEAMGNIVNTGINQAIRYNNYSGFGSNSGLGIGLGKGIVSLGYHETDGRHSFSARVNPLVILNYINWSKLLTSEPSAPKKLALTTCQSVVDAAKRYLDNTNTNIDVLGGGRGWLDYGQAERATKVASYQGSAFNVSASFETNPFTPPIGLTANLQGSYVTQTNTPLTALSAYGYMYAAEANGRRQAGHNDDVIQDFYQEKESPYNERDYFLALPFNNADVFNVSGEGIGGAFRLHHDQTGEFLPNRHESTVNIFSLAGQLHGGPSNYGIGVTVGAGRQTLTEGGWAESLAGSPAPLSFASGADAADGAGNGGEGVFFRFVNDPGSDDNVEQEHTAAEQLSDGAVAAILAANHQLTYSPGLRKLLGQTPASRKVRPQRGSYIGYHTLQQMARSVLTRYCRRSDVWADAYSRQLAGTNKPQHQGLIGELAVTNEAGKKFTYGLPLYSRNEARMQYGVQGTEAASIQSNYLVYTNKDKVKMGEMQAQPYAATYLLTEVATPDYVDRRLDGPTPDDFGGYTAFYYEKTDDFAAGQGYHWRMPFTGHIYERNSLSDPLDDLGAVTSGDKEVAYVRVIQTKTHTAVFETSPRQDGLEAAGDAARSSPGAHGTRVPRQLDKISLYANADVSYSSATKQVTVRGAPIKTVNFHYSYDLCGGTPNSTAPNGGKLTLTSVWSDYNGIAKQRVNLYEFGYQYPTSSGADPLYPTDYLGLLMSVPLSAQNPDYSPFNSDAWGNYQAQGADRYQRLQTWPAQVTPAGFDPAAWHLKVIRLPSKAEIHVQYEQDDYAYVQDQPAHALVSLAATETNGRADNNEFILDPGSVGVSADQVPAMLRALHNYYVLGQHKVYFKFLYSLVEDSEQPTISRCNTDYLAGYTDVEKVEKYPANSLSPGLIKITLKRGDYTLPGQLCADFVNTQRRGRLAPAGNCDPSTSGIQDDDTHPARVVQQLAAFLAHRFDNTKCLTINPALSYFKVPLGGSKKGGGVRVKRLMTYAYDAGLDHEKALYGSEYYYTLEDGKTSSGVATNEPAAMRAENALVGYSPRGGQSWAQKLIGGPDLKQAEGPLGESVLPAPSVGYSRVVECNIMNSAALAGNKFGSKTGPGYTETRYYTARDYPIRYDQTPMQRSTQYDQLVTGLYNSTVNKSYAVQGFSVILNNMHGQLRRTATYAGSYNALSPARGTLMAEQELEYFAPVSDRQVAVWNEPGQGAKLPSALPGREVDVTVAQHAVQDNTLDGSLLYDFTVGIALVFPIPFATLWPAVSKNDAAFYTHTVSKVVRYPAVVKRTRTYKDGITHWEENLAFDQYSGKPVAVRSQDEYSATYEPTQKVGLANVPVATDAQPGFRQGYLKEDVPAAWVYPEKRGKHENEGLVLRQASGSLGQLSGPAAGPYQLASATSQCELLAALHKGDLVMLNGDAVNQVFVSDAPDHANQRVTLYPLLQAASPPLGAVTRLEVLASGNTNELTVPAGATTYHKDELSAGAITLRPYVPKYATAPTAFVTDFNQALQSVLGSLSSAPVGFTVSNPGGYPALDASGFYSQLVARAQSLQGQTGNLTVNNLKFFAQASGKSVKVMLVSFEVKTGLQYTLITN